MPGHLIPCGPVSVEVEIRHTLSDRRALRGSRLRGLGPSHCGHGRSL